MNRDAEALRTPEARVLRDAQASLRPAFGFNLHDQELSTVAQSTTLSAIALLAPAFDAAKSDNDVRSRAKRVSSVLATMLADRIPGGVARYDDSFEQRAFGDNMQRWGTSTILIESGHALGDPQKDAIRRLNVLGILHACDAIGTGAYRAADIAQYDALPFNGKRAYDVVIRNVLIEHGGGRTTPADLAVSYQVDTHSESTPKLADMGDLRPFIGLKEIDGKEARVPGAPARARGAACAPAWPRSPRCVRPGHAAQRNTARAACGRRPAAPVARSWPGIRTVCSRCRGPEGSAGRAAGYRN